MTRKLTDGTVITVSSYINSITKVSKDSIHIDVSKSLRAGGRKPSCIITFISFPLSVPPMQNPVSAMNVGEISPTDVLGIDYFKTYYTVDISNCRTCQDIVWSLIFNYAIPVEPRHLFNLLYNRDEPDNHSVYSLSTPCYAEIISHGTDSGGSYIIWKAYTETPLLGTPYSRTGLGIMLITAEISDLIGNVICTQQAKIDVDCCQKNSLLRNVEIWWEGMGTCEPFIIYGDKHICKMPTSVPIGGASGLIAYSTPFYAAKPLYAIPDVKGGCIPFEWILTGPIELVSPSFYGTMTYFRLTGSDCHAPVTITLKDRCGLEYVVNGSPCCDDAAPLSISYTSLLMGCGQQQDLQAQGGCAPYSWSLSGGGTLSAYTGGTVTYTAPATNPNCTDNPTIEVTDCCGNTSQVKLAVNCYNDPGLALQQSDVVSLGPCYSYPFTEDPTCADICFQNQKCQQIIGGFRNRGWNCSGVLISDCSTGGIYHSCQDSCGVPQCGDPGIPAACWTNQCGGHSPCAACGTLYDERSAEMKAAGCCPMNPFTGLPYD
jgi:hypothetical protein